MVSIATTTNPQIPLFFNIDGNVGQGCPNNAQDVELVSFFFSCVANDPGRPLDQKQVFGKVRPTSTCTPDLVAAINKLSEVLKSPRDGRVSVAKGATGAITGGGAFMIVQLNYQVKKFNTDVWPRIDKMPGCPPGLGSKVRAITVGS